MHIGVKKYLIYEIQHLTNTLLFFGGKTAALTQKRISENLSFLKNLGHKLCYGQLYFEQGTEEQICSQNVQSHFSEVLDYMPQFQD